MEVHSNATSSLPTADTIVTSSDLWYVGLLIQVGAMLCGCLGKQCWRLAALAAPGPVCQVVWRSPRSIILYLCGGLLTLGEPPLETCSLTFAPASIIAASSGLAIVWNVVLAPCTLGEKLTSIRLGAAATIVLGTCLVGVFGPHDEITRTSEEYIALLAQPSAIIYYSLLFLAIVGIAIYVFLNRGQPKRNAVPAIIFSALLLGSNQVNMKVVSELLQCSLDAEREDCGSWEIYVFGFAGVLFAAVGLLNLAYTLRDTEALDTITAYQGCVILVAAVSSMMVLEEQAENTQVRILFYTLSLILILLAVAVLTLREADLLQKLVHRDIVDVPVEPECYERCARVVRKHADALAGGGKLEPSSLKPTEQGKTESTQLLTDPLHRTQK